MRDTCPLDDIEIFWRCSCDGGKAAGAKFGGIMILGMVVSLGIGAAAALASYCYRDHIRLGYVGWLIPVIFEKALFVFLVGLLRAYDG